MTPTGENVQMQSERLIGQVKWFNNKAGYGFVTVSDGEHAGKDIFVHFSTIRVTNSQYKYLIQGEYVELSLIKSTTETHEYQATDVSGIKGGSLMCETRHVNNRIRQPEDGVQNRRRYKVQGDSEKSLYQPQLQRQEDTNGDFVQVKRRRQNFSKKPVTPKSESVN
jgi:cold shock CspA family protein